MQWSHHAVSYHAVLVSCSGHTIQLLLFVAASEHAGWLCERGP